VTSTVNVLMLTLADISVLQSKSNVCVQDYKVSQVCVFRITKSNVCSGLQSKLNVCVQDYKVSQMCVFRITKYHTFVKNKC
jgi:hypothetical protein